MTDDLFILRNINAFTTTAGNSLHSKGYSFNYEVLEKSIIESNRYISKALGIPLASKVLCFAKVRIVEDQPKSIEKIYIEYNKIPGIEQLDLSKESFYSIIKREYGLEINQSEEEILIVEANDKETQILGLEEGAEVLLIKGTTFIYDHEPFELFEIVSVPDFYKFRSEMKL